jgi:hypothetical protein
MTHPILILGNGPSLAGWNLHRIGMATVGMNAAYRYWQRIDFRPTYYTCLDLVVGMSHIDAIARMVEENRIRRFLLRDNACKAIGASPRVINYDELRSSNSFFAVDPITTGSHSLLFAVAFGYRYIGIAGVDLNYKERLDESHQVSERVLEIVRTPANNPNYFFDDYQQAGDRYHIPNRIPGLHREGWERVGEAVAGAGARVFNVAESSPFDLFPHLPLEDFRRLARRSPLSGAESASG